MPVSEVACTNVRSRMHSTGLKLPQQSFDPCEALAVEASGASHDMLGDFIGSPCVGWRTKGHGTSVIPEAAPAPPGLQSPRFCLHWQHRIYTRDSDDDSNRC